MTSFPTPGGIALRRQSQQRYSKAYSSINLVGNLDDANRKTRRPSAGSTGGDVAAEEEVRFPHFTHRKMSKGMNLLLQCMPTIENVNSGYTLEEEDKIWDTFSKSLDAAIRSGAVEAAQKLFTNQGTASFIVTKLDLKDANGFTPLVLAARYGEDSIAELLIDKKAIVEAHNNAALFMAARWGKHRVLSVLLKCNADVSAQVQGVSALFVAARANQVLSAALLLEWKANVMEQDSQRRTALSIAWDGGFLEMVRILVINGARLTDGMWMEASAAPNLCSILGGGLTERIRKLGHDNIPVITLDALYAWLDNAPEACIPLLDVVFWKEVTEGVPTRADLGGQLQHSIYVEEADFDRKLKDFERLCPPDTGKGCTVRIRTFEVRGILRVRLLYALSITQSRHIFSAVTVQALLELSFFKYLFNIFMVDLVMEGFMLLLFWINLMALSAYKDYAFRTSQLAMLFLLIVISLRDMLLAIAIFSYGRSLKKGFLESLRLSKFLSLIPILVYSIQVFSAPETFDLAGQSDLEHHQPSYLPSVAIVTFIRYARLLKMSMEFRLIGINTLPIFYALLQIGAFALMFFLMLFAFMHALYIFYHDASLFLSFLEFATRQVVLGMVTKWPIFMTAFTSDDEILGERYVWLIFWYAVASFGIVIILLQMFVGVLRTAYVDEKSFAHATFLKRKSHTCFEYFLLRQRRQHIHWVKELLLRLVGTFVQPPDNGLMWLCETTEEDRETNNEEVDADFEQDAYTMLEKQVSQSSETVNMCLDHIRGIEKKVTDVVQHLYTGISSEEKSRLRFLLER